MSGTTLDLDDIQGRALQPLPLPYTGVLDLLRIDDPRAGCRFLANVLPSLRTAANPMGPQANAWLSIALSYRGFQALGVEQDSLDSFAPEFREGMARRAARLHDIGESAPERWEEPFGSGDVHVALTAMAPDQDRLGVLMKREDDALADITGVVRIYREECRSSNGREAFGFRDNISQPAVEGTDIPGSDFSTW